jgi:hypothetical protein
VAPSECVAWKGKTAPAIATCERKCLDERDCDDGETCGTIADAPSPSHNVCATPSDFLRSARRNTH